jgi:hypothetical protein
MGGVLAGRLPVSGRLVTCLLEREHQSGALKWLDLAGECTTFVALDDFQDKSGWTYL